jgi:eukaryotic-like serine/threonine-protein kinase
MEFLEGAPLKGPMSAAQVVTYGVQILEALETAHRKGIVHRDLKPANVLVTPQGVKLLDFGLAKMRIETPGGEEETQSMDLTRVGAIVGTPDYMAPEQWEGRAADPRSDIYAFGCLLYEMLTGKKAGADRAPVKPARLERVLAKCLARNPDERWQSAAEVKAILQRSSARRTWKYAVAAAAVLVLAGAAVFVWQRRHAAVLTDKDVLVLSDFANTTGDPVFDGALRQALVFQLEQSPFLKIMDDEEVHHALELMRRAPAEHLSAPVARDVCRRENEEATLEGSISGIGQTYLLTL